MIHKKNTQNTALKQLKFLVGVRKGKTNPNGVFVETKFLVFDKIIDNFKEILETKTIDFSKLKEEDNSNFFGDEWIRYFISKNKTSISEEGIVLPEQTEIILNLLLKAIEEDNKSHSFETLNSPDTRTSFKNVVDILDVQLTDEEIEVVEQQFNLPFEEVVKKDILKPLPNFTGFDFKNNEFLSNAVFYSFNDNLKNINTTRTPNERIATQQLEIVEEQDVIEYPTKYKAICTKTNGQGVECGRIVEYYEDQLNSEIKCTKSLGTRVAASDESHVLKNLTKKNCVQTRMLYSYTVRLVSPSSAEHEKDFIAYFLNKPKSSSVLANVVSLTVENSRVNIITAYKNLEPEIKLTSKILIETTHKTPAVSVIFKSAANYLKKYHNINLREDGIVISECLIEAILLNHFFDEIIKTVILGSSASGKTFLAKLLCKLLSTNPHIGDAKSITRNKLLGGRGALKDAFGSSVFVRGYLSSKSIVVLEEGGDTLDAFSFSVLQGKPIDMNTNVFAMTKGYDEKGDTINVDVQGSMPSKLNATLILLGNLDNLQVKNKYSELVRKKYNSMIGYNSTNKYTNDWPLYRQPEEYIRKYNNIPLAKAHILVREELNRHYISFLTEPEHSRFGRFLVIENNIKEYKDKELKQDINKLKHLHTKEFLSEIREVLGDCKIPLKLKEEVKDFFNKEILRNRNNILTLQNKNMYTHMIEKLINKYSCLVYMNKKFWRDSNLEYLDIDNKNYIVEEMKYEHNVLNLEELNKRKQPYYNDNLLNFDDIANEELKLKEERRLEREKAVGINDIEAQFEGAGKLEDEEK